MARYAMAFDYKLCINCKACEVACKEENGILLGADKHRLWINVTEAEGDFWNLDRTAVEYMPTQCQQCENPPCLDACPRDAIYIDKNGIVRLHKELCDLTQLCIKACPYDARYVNSQKNIVDKCNFCADTRLSRGLTTTACQVTCPSKVRIFGDLDNPNSEISQILKKRDYFQLKIDKGTKPKLFYLK